MESVLAPITTALSTFLTSLGGMTDSVKGIYAALVALALLGLILSRFGGK